MGNTRANMVGVHVQDTGTSPDSVRVIMVGDNGCELACMDMAPEDTRRLALRLLQTCELAEGKAPVNA
jgi:hypothetical protein